MVDDEWLGPRRFSRAGILITILLNVILCEFVYLPVFAVPEFNDIHWSMDLFASRSTLTPSLAVLQNANLQRRATLESNSSALNDLCQSKLDAERFDNQRCFNGFSTMGMNIKYVTFNGSTYDQSITLDDAIDLWYRYSCKSARHRKL